MSFTTFLLRLVGRSPEQVEEQKRFERNLKGLSRTEEDLDQLLQEIREVDHAYQEKKTAFEQTERAASSLAPPELEDDNDVRITYASEHDL